MHLEARNSFEVYKSAETANGPDSNHLNDRKAFKKLEQSKVDARMQFLEFKFLECNF